MSSSSESDFETNFFEKDHSGEFSNENELSDSLRERFSNILPYQFEPEKEENCWRNFMLIASTKISESQRSISPFSFYGQLPDY